MKNIKRLLTLLTSTYEADREIAREILKKDKVAVNKLMRVKHLLGPCNDLMSSIDEYLGEKNRKVYSGLSSSNLGFPMKEEEILKKLKKILDAK